MQYNSNSTSQDIVTMSEKLCQANSVSFPIEEKTLYANEGSKIIWSWIHEAYGGWSFDDGNETDLPSATTTLNASQTNYSIPTDAEYVVGVSVKTTGGTWQRIYPITLEQIQDTGMPESEFYSTASQPMRYRLVGNSVVLYPASNYTQSASLKIWYKRDISLFTTTDTTKTPGWSTEFHEALPTYMALQYSMVNQTPQEKGLSARWVDYQNRIKSYYSRRFAELFPPRITVRDFTRENQ